MNFDWPAICPSENARGLKGGCVCRTVDEGIHGGVNQILDQVVAPRVPIRLGALLGAQLLKRSL